MLSNLSKVVWKEKKNTAIICFLLSSFALNEKISKNPKNWWNSTYWRRKSSYFLNDERNFNVIFKKDVPYDSIKSHLKIGLHPLPSLARSVINLMVSFSYLVFYSSNWKCVILCHFHNESLQKKRKFLWKTILLDLLIY